jgi:hypothetical protein
MSKAPWAGEPRCRHGKAGRWEEQDVGQILATCIGDFSFAALAMGSVMFATMQDDTASGIEVANRSCDEM